ncbi:hypothetical protein [uncultured Maribacter sp.]|mgnify:CR=1 FL=1|uniref:hypothetical protein n=1 Tax=uncultured Maribacter sp. TaxID=431308 RepID=UPI0030D709A5|tara:strand:- start:186 stop:419 length:234 start_codon:yes stop_codon:yes gene_type:complete
MKKILFTLFLTITFGVGLNANAKTKRTINIQEFEYLDCMAEATGYYNFLLEEGVSERKAQKRANVFLNACLEVGGIQ